MKFFKRQKKDNIELDEVYRLLKGYYRCSADEGYPFLFMSDDFLNTLHWTQKEIETKFDKNLYTRSQKNVSTTSVRHVLILMIKFISKRIEIL